MPKPKTVHVRRPPKQMPDAVARVIAKTEKRGDSDLKVLERVLTSLRQGCDPTGTNDSWNAAFFLCAIQDHRETRRKPTLRADYRPKHNAKA